MGWSKGDGRVKNLKLSEKAYFLLVQLQSKEDAQLRQVFFTGFAPSEVDLFTNSLKRVAQNMGDTSDNKF